MDRKIEKKTITPKRVLGVIGLVVVALLAVSTYLKSRQGSTFRIDKNRVIISTVKIGEFQDFIPIRGTVTPLNTVYLDSVEDGRVERLYVEAGSMVTKGQKILDLSNTSLQLEMITREAQISEQLNNLRNTRLAIEQSELGNRQSLLEVGLEISRNKRLLDEAELDLNSGFISKNQRDEVKERYEYFLARKNILETAKRQEEELHKAQLNQLENTTQQLEKNLIFARKSLGSLLLTAPIDGLLSFLDAEIGQSKTQGERLGQIDDPNAFKLTTQIDEHFLTRVRTDQKATVNHGGTQFNLTVAKVFPQVTDGQFDIELTFDGEMPTDIRRGQTLQLSLELGNPTQAMLLANGGFFQDTGGDWVFLLTEEGIAVKQSVRLGRRNIHYFEVLEGLTPGDKVIVSGYASYAKMDRIELN